jgi:probable HAF family extracellular repeat protein
LPGGDFSSSAEAINDLGQVVGASVVEGNSHAFIWDSDTMTDLGTFGGQTIAFDINNRGQVVGYSSGVEAHRPVIWDAVHGMVDMGDFPTPPTYAGSHFYFPYGINDSGQIAGSLQGYRSSKADYVYGFLHQNGSWTDLGGLPYSKGWVTYPKGINELGQIVGSGFTDASGQVLRRAFLWQNDSITDLGALPGGNGHSSAWAINNLGQIVGDSDGNGLGGRVTLWDHGTIVQLPNLIGDNFGEAFSINDSGQVVGRSIFSGTVNGQSVFQQRACLWESGQVYDLNVLTSLQPSSQLIWASDINSNGQICGQGINMSGYSEAFLLTPVAEPPPVPGDANGDGVVDDKDASILGANWLHSGTWLDGDFNGDGNINDADAAILAAHWGEGAGEESVPEPGSLALLAGMAVMELVYLRRRKA